MPEKPEVITVMKALKPKLIGRQIIQMHVYWENILAKPKKEEFIKRICGQKIQTISTRGKWIVITLEKDVLLIHLRMEGKFIFRKKGDLLSKHEHVEFILDDSTSLRFHDVRKFGKMYLIAKEKLEQEKPISLLGLEFNDKNLTKNYLFEKLRHRNQPIKTVLLDQSIIAGIGNIYDDEILFLSQINVFKKASDLTCEECDKIIKNCRLVLTKAIDLGGTTIKSFTSEEGVHGRFQNELLVHGKKGEACPVCGTFIQKQSIHGRGTYFCPNCQK